MELKRILIVEPHVNWQREWGQVLRGVGFDVRISADAVSAVQAAVQFQPDLILLSELLPGGDAYALIPRLKKMSRLALCPMIILSEDSSGARKTQALTSGAVDFLDKSVHSNVLVEKIEYYLGTSDVFKKRDLETDVPTLSIPLFRGLKLNDVDQILRESKRRVLKKGDLVYRAEESPRSLYLIVKGEIEFVSATGVEFSLKAGEFFGEQSLVQHAKTHSHSARAKMASELIELDEENLKIDIVKYPTLRKQIEYFFYLREFLNLKSKGRLLKAFTDEELYKIFDLFSIRSFRQGETLFKAGDSSSEFYILVEGEVRVRGEHGMTRVLGAGEWVGEMAFIEYENHSAQCTAIGNLRTLACTRTAFEKLGTQLPSFKDLIVGLAKSRKIENRRAK